MIELLTALDVAMTTDLWMAIGVRGYITITAHYICDWKYNTSVIVTRPLDEKHTAVNINKSY